MWQIDSNDDLWWRMQNLIKYLKYHLYVVLWGAGFVRVFHCCWCFMQFCTLPLMQKTPWHAAGKWPFCATNSGTKRPFATNLPLWVLTSLNIPRTASETNSSSPPHACHFYVCFGRILTAAMIPVLLFSACIGPPSLHLTCGLFAALGSVDGHV